MRLTAALAIILACTPLGANASWLSPDGENNGNVGGRIQAPGLRGLQEPIDESGELVVIATELEQDIEELELQTIEEVAEDLEIEIEDEADSADGTPSADSADGTPSADSADSADGADVPEVPETKIIEPAVTPGPTTVSADVPEVKITEPPVTPVPTTAPMASPGNSGSAPGITGNTPGNSGNRWGARTGPTASPGNSGNAPWRTGSTPGNSGNATRVGQSEVQKLEELEKEVETMVNNVEAKKAGIGRARGNKH